MTTRYSSPGDTTTDLPKNTVVFQHDWTERDELVGKIVSAVAEVTGADETDVERIYDRVDPESLNTLFSQAHVDRDAADARLVFSLQNCTVTVSGSGLVVVQQ